MSKEIVFDRRKGFVALPVQVLELDLSPGAFRLLVELCRMANLDGMCWPSLGQLGERLGRSRAAVSGYVKELRDADLISTEEQRTANGYNYRLRYCVRFWKDWRASLSGHNSGSCRVKTSEGRIQPTERMKESKKHIQKNHDQSALVVCKKLVSEWAALTKGAPYPALHAAPSEDLISKTQLAVNTAGSKISADISSHMNDLWNHLKLDSDPVAAKKVVDFLRTKSLTPPDLASLIATIKAGWQPHWRKIPSPKQLAQMLKTAEFEPHSVLLSLLKSYLRRWKKAQMSLHSRTSCENLPLGALHARRAPSFTYIRGYS